MFQILKWLGIFFTKGGHHNRFGTFLLLQNLYPQGKKAREISINAQYYLLTKSSRDFGQIAYFGRQAYGNRKGQPFLEAYIDAVDKPFNPESIPFLYVNCHPRGNPTCRLMSNVLSPDGIKVVYKLD